MCGWDIQKVDKKYSVAPRPKAKQVILHNLRYLTEILIYSQHHWHLLWPQHNKQLILQIKLTLHYWLRCKTHRWRRKEVWEIRRYEQKQETQSATPPLQKITIEKPTYLSEAGCEEHALEKLPHLLKKLVNVGSFQHIYLENTWLRWRWRWTRSVDDRSTAQT